MPLKHLTDGNPDGSMVGSSPSELVGFWGGGPVPQRSNPQQAMIQGVALGSLVNYPSNCGVVGAANANQTTMEQTFNFASIQANDMIAVSRAAGQANLGIGGLRVANAGNICVNFANPSAANVTPTANETWSVTAIRGLAQVSANLKTWTANVAPANGTVEVAFSIAPTGAAATAYINANSGQITKVQVTAGGSGYVVPPTVIFTPPNPIADNVQTGTFAGLPGAQGGVAATGVAIVSGGAVVGVEITNPGQGYGPLAPVVSFIGGSYIAPGMVVMAQKPTTQDGLGIGNVRVSGINQVAITLYNNTAAAITPTANESWKFLAFNEMAAMSPFVVLGANIGTANAAAANASNQTTITVTGLLTTDVCLGVNPPVLQSPVSGYFGYIASANALTIGYGAGVPGATPTANSIFNVAVFRPAAPAVANLLAPYLTPTAVTAGTIGEQAFTVAGLTANCTVVVNKQSYTPGLTIVGARVSAANTLQINYQNNSTADITPPAETYLIASLQSLVVPVGGSVSQSVGITFNQMQDLQNEMQQTLQVSGFIKGA